MTRPEVYWVDLSAGVRLAIMPRRRAGDWLDDEVAGWRAEGIGVIVSLLEAGEFKELSLHREAGLCHDLDMEFIVFPVQDGGVPAATRKTMALVEAIVARLGRGESRCRASPGRDRAIIAHRGMRPRAFGFGSGDGIRSHRQGAGHQGHGHRRTTRLGRYVS
jgi:hypothetical protein